MFLVYSLMLCQAFRNWQLFVWMASSVLLCDGLVHVVFVTLPLWVCENEWVRSRNRVRNRPLIFRSPLRRISDCAGYILCRSQSVRVTSGGGHKLSESRLKTELSWSVLVNFSDYIISTGFMLCVEFDKYRMNL